MKKVIFVVLIMVFMLALATTAFAEPNPPPNPNGGSCNMLHSWWSPDGVYEPGGEPDYGPGNANGVETGERGMNHVHTKDNPNGYTNGAHNMDLVTSAQCS